MVRKKNITTYLPSSLDDRLQDLEGVVFGLLIARELQNCVHLQIIRYILYHDIILENYFI
jgi:hypothetical protein